MKVMLDIETLDVRPTALILQIGGVAFNDETIFEETAFLGSTGAVNIDDYTISKDTENWWRTQPAEAQESLSLNLYPNHRTLLEALYDWMTEVGFKREYRNGSEYEVWMNGPAFDGTILDHAHRVEDVRKPWHFRQERCFRTALALFPLPSNAFGGKSVKDGLVNHRADHDAIKQARVLLASGALDVR